MRRIKFNNWCDWSKAPAALRMFARHFDGERNYIRFEPHSKLTLFIACNIRCSFTFIVDYKTCVFNIS